MARWLTVATACIALTVWVWIAWRYRRWRWSAVIPASYALHVLAFYTAVVLKWLPPADLNIWSSAVRLQGLLLLLVLALYVCKVDKHG